MDLPKGETKERSKKIMHDIYHPFIMFLGGPLQLHK